MLRTFEEDTPFGGDGGDVLGVSTTAGGKAEGEGDVGLISGGFEGEEGEGEGEGNVVLIVEFDILLLSAITITTILSFFRQFSSFPLMK